MALSFIDPELETNVSDSEIILTSLQCIQEDVEEVRCTRWEVDESMHEFLIEFEHKYV